MAVIRLQVQIDSDVYPELYARLSGIPRAEAREERLRLLAASGLVWEAVRMHGRAATAMPPPPMRPVLPAAASRAAASAGPAAPLAQVPAPAVPPPLAVPRQVPVLRDVVDAAAGEAPQPPDDAPPLPPPLDSGMPRATPRSARLKRMVDRGLFKNG